jgi:hypothetical protein
VNTHVILTLEEAEWLDEQCLAMRRKAGARVSRSRLLRGIVNGLRNSNIFAGCRNEEEIAGVLVQREMERGRSPLVF